MLGKNGGRAVNLEDRIPPQALDIERTVLGSVLTDKEAMLTAQNILTNDCFYTTQNALIWDCLFAMKNDGIPIDCLTVAEELRKKDQLESIGAEPYLSELVSCVATAWNIESHCKILIEKSILRKTIENCHNISERAFSGEAPETVVKSVSEMSNNLNTRMEEASLGIENSVKIMKIKDLSEITKKYHKEGDLSTVFNLKTLPTLSKIYKPALGLLNVFTGLPGSGKTQLLNQIMIDLSLNENWKWLVFSPESFPHYYLIQDLAEKLLGKPFRSGDNAMCSEEVDSAIEWLNDRIDIIDIGIGEFTSDDLLSLLREYSNKNSIQGFVLDPIKDLEISQRKSENRTYSIGRFLNLIHRMGSRKDFTPFIVAHTTKLQKDFKTHKYPVPTLFDIDGSAAYWNAAFQGLTTYRYYKLDVIAVHVQKIKWRSLGTVGVECLQYHKDTGIFTEYHENPEKVEKQMVEQGNLDF